MNDDIQAQARRELVALREGRGLQPHPPTSLGLIFSATPGMSQHHGGRPYPLPVPLEEWAAATDPWDDEEPPPTR